MATRRQERPQSLRTLGRLKVKLGQGGFTLIELLVTVSILAAVAFVAAGNYIGISEHANDQLVRTEMQEIAQAIRQFRQDTGYYPKTGPFGMDDDGLSGVIDYADLPAYAGADDAEKKVWFYSPANFWLLLTSDSPLPGGHPLETWDAESGRGWRGPYLKGFADGYVNISNNVNDGTAAGNTAGDPTETVSAVVLTDVDGLADPFEHRPHNNLLGWSLKTGSSRDERDTWGRPYLLFNLNSRPLLVSSGPDGDYVESNDNIRLEIE